MDKFQAIDQAITAALAETYEIRKTLRAVDMLTMGDSVGRVEHWLCSIRADVSSMQREQALAALPPLDDIARQNMVGKVLQMLRQRFDYDSRVAGMVSRHTRFKDDLKFDKYDWAFLAEAVSEVFQCRINEPETVEDLAYYLFDVGADWKRTS